MAVELREAGTEDVTAARRRWEQRHRSWWADQGIAAEGIAARLEQFAVELSEAAERAVRLVEFEGAFVGSVSVSTYDRADGVQGLVEDIWIEPERRGQRLGRATLRAVEDWLRRERNAVAVSATIDPSNPAHAALFGDYRLQSQRMALPIDSPPTLPERFDYRPFPEAAFDAWLVGETEGFAHSLAESGELSIEEARQRSAKQLGELLPDGLATPDHAFWALNVEGEQVAMIWLKHHRESMRSFVYMVEVDSEHRGKGYGKVVMRLGEQLTYEAGDTVLALNVFGHNPTAIGLYTSLGYTISDQSRIKDLTA